MMNDVLNDYIPIDYRSWVLGDEARRGVNLVRLNLLEQKEIDIFNAAASYNDARNDAGQAELVAYFSVRLLNYLKNGRREVVVPAAILHDVGFYFDGATTWKKLVDSGGDTASEINRRPHQNRGLLFAGKILESVGYSEEYFCEIADIIGDHDTRKLPTTNSGEIIRAADLLWRVTFPHLKIYLTDAGPGEALKRMEESALNKSFPFNLDKAALSIGRIELVNTMIYKFGDKCYSLLKEKHYEKELVKVLSFYEIS